MDLAAHVDLTFSDFFGPVGFSCFPIKSTLYCSACCAIHEDICTVASAFSDHSYSHPVALSLNILKSKIKKSGTFNFVLFAPHISLSSINSN